MAERPLRFVVCGAGFGAYGYVPALRRVPGVSVTALCAPTAGRRDVAAARLGIARTFSDAVAMLDEVQPDAVAVAVPPRAQGAILSACSARRLPVFAEKPFGIDVAEARHLAKQSEDARLPTGIGFLFPEIAAWREAKRQLDAGAIGRLRHVVATWSFESHDNARRLSSWKTDVAAGGGALSHFGTHAFHDLEWLCGPIKTLQAGIGRDPGDARTGDTLVTMAIGFESGASASSTICTAAPFGPGRRIELYGANGTLVLADGGMGPVDFSLFHAERGAPILAPLPVASDGTPERGEDSRVIPLARLLQRFASSVRGGPPMRPNFADGLRSRELCASALASAAAPQHVDRLLNSA